MKFNRPIFKSVVTALCVLSLSSALASAAGKSKRGEERGVIKAVDMNAHTLVVTQHKKITEQTFQWNDQTKFTEHKKATDASALKDGELVRLTFKPGHGTPVLQSVQIVPARRSKTTASNHSPARSSGA